MNLVIESDGNLIWQAADDCRVIITKLQLIVPRLLVNSEGQKLYMKEYLNTRKLRWLVRAIKSTSSFFTSTVISVDRHL